MKQADICFVTDISGSVGIIDFEKMRTFMMDLVARMVISPDDVRIALITYAELAKVIFHHNTYGHVDGVLEAITATNYNRSDKGVPSTNTAAGLRVAREQVFPPLGTGRPVQRLAIVITDGRSNYPLETILGKIFILFFKS